MKFVVTAGPTREYLDPVRFLSNPSTGKMGFAVARAAAMRGHEVVLVAGPVSLKTPKGVRRIDVTSARDMLAAVEEEMAKAKSGKPTIFVATAAVADWRPAKCAPRKLKKGQMSDTLKLVRNPDILKEIGRRTKTAQSPTRPIIHSPTYLVGFAAETNDVIAEARRKCREKNLDMIVANDVTRPGAGFAVETNVVTMLAPGAAPEPLPLLPKAEVARRLVARIEGLVAARRGGAR